MAEVLVLVEHAEGAVKKVTTELLTAARALGEPAAVVVGKPGTAEPLLDELRRAGAAKIYVAESDDVDGYLVTPQVDVLASLVESAEPGRRPARRDRRRQGDRRSARRPHRVRRCCATSSRSKRAARVSTRSSAAPTPSRPRPPVTPR